MIAGQFVADSWLLVLVALLVHYGPVLLFLVVVLGLVALALWTRDRPPKRRRPAARPDDLDQ